MFLQKGKGGKMKVGKEEWEAKQKTAVDKFNKKLQQNQEKGNASEEMKSDRPEKRNALDFMETETRRVQQASARLQGPDSPAFR